MKKGFLLSILAFLFFAFSATQSSAQNNVGIGTNQPDTFALVDMVSTATGLLIPRLDSTARLAIPLNLVRRSMIVYDTDYGCFFYINNAASGWVSLCNAFGPTGATGPTGPTGPSGPAGATGAISPASCSIDVELTLGAPSVTSGLVKVTDSCGVVTSTNSAWITKGNYNTTAGTHYIGTNDIQDFIFKTGGAAAANERMRILSNGQIVANSTTVPNARTMFSVYHASPSFTGDTAIFGSALGNSLKVGVLGVASQGKGVMGRATTGRGVYGTATQAGIGVFGVAAGQGTGVYGENGFNGLGGDFANTANGGALRAINTSNATQQPSIFAMNAGGPFGIWTLDKQANSTGIAAEGGGLPTTYYTGQGTGGAFNGSAFGVYGKAYDGGVASRTAGGFFQDSLSRAPLALSGTQTWVACYDGGGTNLYYKDLGSGAASTLVYDKDQNVRVMFCPEAPEVLFEDYGSATLSNGSTYVNLDEIFANNVQIDSKHPLRVFVQLEGDCNGVYVTEKSANGFMVKELNNGQSNVKFTYHIVANRVNTAMETSAPSKYADARFPIFDPLTPTMKAKAHSILDQTNFNGNNPAGNR